MPHKSKLFITLGALLALTVYFYQFNPSHQKGFFLKCPLNQLTGIQCPGCGSQRAVHALLHFNFLEALKFNALLVLSLPYLLLGFVFDFWKPTNPTALKWRKLLYGNTAIYIVIGIVLSFTLLRNLYS